MLRPSFREPPGHPGGPAQASPPDSNTSWSGACGSGGAREDPTPTGRQGRRCQLPLQSSREALVACTHLFSRVCMHSFTRVRAFVHPCMHSENAHLNYAPLGVNAAAMFLQVPEPQAGGQQPDTE